MMQRQKLAYTHEGVSANVLMATVIPQLQPEIENRLENRLHFFIYLVVCTYLRAVCSAVDCLMYLSHPKPPGHRNQMAQSVIHPWFR